MLQKQEEEILHEEVDRDRLIAIEAQDKELAKLLYEKVSYCRHFNSLFFFSECFIRSCLSLRKKRNSNEPKKELDKRHCSKNNRFTTQKIRP